MEHFSHSEESIRQT